MQGLPPLIAFPCLAHHIISTALLIRLPSVFRRFSSARRKRRVLGSFPPRVIFQKASEGTQSL